MNSPNLIKIFFLYLLISLFSFHAWSAESEIMKESHEIKDLIEYEHSADCNVEVDGIERGYNDNDLKIIATHLRSHRMRSTDQAPTEYILKIHRQSRKQPTLFSGTDVLVEAQVSVYRVHGQYLEQVATETRSHEDTADHRLQTSYRSLNAAMALLPTCWDLRHPEYTTFEMTHPFGVHLPKTFCLWTTHGNRCVEQKI